MKDTILELDLTTPIVYVLKITNTMFDFLQILSHIMQDEGIVF